MKLIKSWEVVLGIIILFMICSTSLYWYDHFNKSRKHSIEQEMKAKYEKDSMIWQIDVTTNIEALKKTQDQIIGLLNSNIKSGRLENKK